MRAGSKSSHLDGCACESPQMGVEMRTMSKITKKIWIPFFLAVVLASAGFGTLAFLSHATGSLTNQFSIGTVTTQVNEDTPSIADGIIRKNPRVLNTGSVSCLVRVRINLSPESLRSYADFNIGSDWEYRDDGFYYYKHVLPPGESTPALFTSVGGILGHVGEGTEITTFQITVYQEAVQAEVFDALGNKISASDSGGGFHSTNASTIWSIYDGGSTP